jgi:DNA-binding GntR family transcriptional regulator
MSVTPIVHQNLSDKIYEAIKESIVRWEFRPGQRLIDAELAIEFGVSRSLVRNAIAFLVNDGLVEVARRRFYVVRFTQKDIRDLLELRHILEMAMLPAAMQNVPADLVGAMQAGTSAAEAAFRAGNLEQFYAVDVETHQMIIDHCANEQIRRVYANLRTQLRMVIRSDFDKQPKISESLGEHRVFIDAWKRGDAAATAAALDHHLGMAERRVMENFAQALSDLETDEDPAEVRATASRRRP